MTSQFSHSWEDQFKEFTHIPFAAASIGQVHKAILHDGREVAVKIQYPGVAKSINSDLNNLKTLLLVSNLLPPGLYLENTIKVAQRELALECDYVREADCMKRMKTYLESSGDWGPGKFNVSTVVEELCTPMVLTVRILLFYCLCNLAHSSYNSQLF